MTPFPSAALISEARRLLDAATPGPWVVDQSRECSDGDYDELGAAEWWNWELSASEEVILGGTAEENPHSDLAFIAAAPELVRHLTDALEAAEAQVGHWQKRAEVEEEP